ncbi:PASTA domain-containing protein [Arthrobacter sp. PAMC 25486]|uniref:PASTA domain-containing protein n=1 Tax=Arthrobacter sp. PAMC 25486 TaxID=1494608 RepID=UPI000AC34F08|nr:PASTA domain-containing protein [Arthrobacter sp. PAMC 25486]
MKKFIQFSVAALLVAGLAACGTDAPATSPSESPSVTATTTQEQRAVPDVVGMTYKEAYETLVKDDFFAQLVDKTGATWVEGSPWADAKVASTDPAAGTMTDESYVNVALEPTQEEYAAQTKAAE